jgi:hypothetical protein
MRKENNVSTKSINECRTTNDLDNSRAHAKKARNVKTRRRSKTNSNGKSVVSTDSIASDGKVMNNPNYYFTDAELAKQATSISFNTFLGTSDDYSGEGTNATNTTPTVMIIHTMPTAGPMDPLYSGASGINMAGRKLYTRLSSINAKTTNYAPQDLITLMLSLGSVLEMISFIRRAFGLAFTTSYRNRIVPKEILRMMGIDADDFFKNIAAYRLEFNTLINMITKIPFPANVAYFEKCATMHDHIWTDSADMAIAQLYAIVPKYLWKFNETYSEQGTGLNTIDLSTDGSHIKQMSSYLDTFSEMIEQLLTSSTLNFIYADILNLAAKENIPLYQVSFVPEDYTVIPEYNAEALLQIHNITFVGYPEEANAAKFTNWTPQNDVVPNVNKNTIDYYPSFSATNAALNTKRIIDFPNGTPDVAEIIEATRYAAIASDASLVADTYHVTGVALGDHVANDVIVYYTTATVVQTYPHSSSSLVTTATSSFALANDFSKFDWSPILFGSVNSDKTRFTNVLGDLNYYTFIDREYLTRVDDLAMMALFELR